MKIDKQIVEKIAHLSRLEINEQEREKMVEDLPKIMNWMNQLNELDTDSIEPLTHMSEAVNIFREDEVRHELPREKGLLNAPNQNGVYFQVPKVIE